MYNFYVKNASDVDIARILNEAPAETDAILLVGANAVLLLKKTLLNRFSAVDRRWVASEVLNPTWGWYGLSALEAKNAVSFMTIPTSAGGTCVDVGNLGWRARLIEDKKDIEKILADLKAARAFELRREVREVRVSYV